MHRPGDHRADRHHRGDQEAAPHDDHEVDGREDGQEEEGIDRHLQAAGSVDYEREAEAGVPEYHTVARLVRQSAEVVCMFSFFLVAVHVKKS